MQIRISKAELLSMLSKQLGYEVTEVVLEKPTKAIIDALCVAMMGYVKGYSKENSLANVEEFNAFVQRSDKKILCIKALRDVIRNNKMEMPKDCGNVDTYGLAEAKAIIENWSHFHRWVARNNRLPSLRNISYNGEPPTFV